MKQITLMFTFVLALGLVSATAQSDAPAKKSCAKPCMGVAKTQDAGDAGDAGAMAAATLAAQDASIEKQVCEESGKVSYVRLVTDENGAVAKKAVHYDVDKGEFVESAAAKKACCAGDAKQSCCSKGSASKAGCSSKEKASKKSST
jgi:hypothetical protein